MSDRPPPVRAFASAVAAVFALLCFVVAIASGTISGSPAESVLLQALVWLVAGWPIGWIAARIVLSQFGDEPSQRGAAAGASSGEEVRADGDSSIGAGQHATHARGANPNPTVAQGADTVARARRALATTGPEENPTVRQEVRSRARST